MAKEDHRLEYTRKTFPKPVSREQAIKEQEAIKKRLEAIKRRAKQQ